MTDRTSERRCECFGDSGLHASTHGDGKGGRLCDLCGWPVRNGAPAMTRRERISDWARLRGGPGWDYPCDNPHMIECASSHCQKARRCRMKDYFALGRSDGECVPADKTKWPRAQEEARARDPRPAEEIIREDRDARDRDT